MKYLSSKAFTEKDSREISSWDIGPRASMGLEFADLPRNFTSRYIIPIEKGTESREILDSAVLHHRLNLYFQVVQISRNLLLIHHVVLSK
jgi:hypothetical protein